MNTGLFDQHLNLQLCFVTGVTPALINSYCFVSTKFAKRHSEPLEQVDFVIQIFHTVLSILHCHCPHFHSRLHVLPKQADIANILSSGVQVAGHFPVGSASSCRGLVIRVDIGSYVNLVKLPFPCVQGGNPKHLGQLTGGIRGSMKANLIMLLVKSISILIFFSHLEFKLRQLHNSYF